METEMRRLGRLLGQERNLPVVNPAQKHHSERSPDQRHRHVGLRVPDVTLSAEKTVRRVAGGDGHAPLEHFIERAEGETDRDHEQIEPAAAIHNGITKQNFSRQDRSEERRVGKECRL